MEEEYRKKKRTCPECGMGVMPDSHYCIRCGEKLPAPEKNPEIAKTEEERRRQTLKLFIFHIFPGLLSVRTLAASVFCFSVSLVFARLAESSMENITGLDAIFYFPAYAGAATAALAAYGTGLFFILYGHPETPLKIIYDLRRNQWVAFLTLLTAGIGVYGLVRGMM